MRVTLITTINHNIGDDFVREGILYLLEKKLGTIRASIIHKHIPLTARPEWEWFYEKGISRILDKLPKVKGLFWSEIIDHMPLNMKTDKVLTCDLLVQSGAPVYWKGAHISEWYGPLIRRRFQIIKHRVPFINIGVGACYPYHSNGTEVIGDPQLSDFIKELHYVSAVTTVRDALSKSILNLLGLDAPIIPCPSLFAADRLKISPRESEYVALNYMPLGGHWSFGQKIDTGKWERTFIDLFKTISGKTPVLIVCHDAVEYRHIRRILPDAPVFFRTTANEYLECYSRAQCFIGNRVHGAYAVASFGRPSLVVGNDTRTRMMEVIGLPSIFVNDATIDLLLSYFHEFERTNDSYVEEMLVIKKNAYDSYMNSLTKIYDWKLGPGWTPSVS